TVSIGSTPSGISLKHPFSSISFVNDTYSANPPGIPSAVPIMRMSSHWFCIPFLQNQHFPHGITGAIDNFIPFGNFSFLLSSTSPAISCPEMDGYCAFEDPPPYVLKSDP